MERVPQDSHREDLALIVDVVKGQRGLVLGVGGADNQRVVVARHERLLFSKRARGDALGGCVEEETLILPNHLHFNSN